jgi:PST family polysaccharide transporter
VFAYRGYGVWSIVIQTLLNSLISSVWYRAVSRIRPVLKFNKKSFRSFISMGSNIAGDTMINYWSRNADNLLIGKFVGEQSLGLYNRAYTLMLLPLNNISRVITRVMFPSFSRIKDNRSEIKRLYIKINQTIALITFPLMFGLAVTSNIFVPAVYGSNWSDMIPILQILAIVGAFQSLLSLSGSIYISLGKARMSFRLTLIYNIVYVSGFITGLLWNGLQGMVYVYSVLAVVGVLPHLYITGRLISLSLTELFRHLLSVFSATILMAVLVWIAKSNDLAGRFTSVLQWQLLVYVTLGVILYIIFCSLFKVEAFLMLKKSLFYRLTNKKNL